MNSSNNFQKNKKKFLAQKIWESRKGNNLYLWIIGWGIIFGFLCSYTLNKLAPLYGWPSSWLIHLIMFFPSTILGIGIAGVLTELDYAVRKMRTQLHQDSSTMSKIKNRTFTHHIYTLLVGLFVGLLGAILITIISKGLGKFSLLILFLMLPAGIALGLGVTGVIKDCTEEAQETITEEDKEAERKAVQAEEQKKFDN